MGPDDLGALADASTRHILRELEAVGDPGYDGSPEYREAVLDEAEARGL
jgi:hypothetical protein